MKKTFQILWKHLNGWNGLIFSVYCFIIIFTIEFQLFFSVSSYFVIILSILSIVSVFIICPILLRKIKNLKIVYRVSSLKPSVHFLVFFILTLMVFLLWFFAFFPGGFNPDSLNQLKQVYSGKYNDWHPFLHTLFSFTFPLFISDNAIWAVSLFQLVSFSVAIAYMGITLLKYSNAIFAYCSIGVLIINPVICGASVYAIKDTFVGVFVILCMSFILHVFFSKGKWLLSWINVFKFCIVLIAISLFRHNTFLFTLPLYLVILLFATKKVRITSAVILICLTILLKIVIPIALNVEQPDKRQLESLGLPLTVLSDVYIYDNDALDNETKEFMQQVTSKDNWENYERSDFNSVKWKGVNSELIETTGTINILKMFIKACISSPGCALLAIMNLTGMVYQPFAESHSSRTTKPYIEKNDYGIEWQGNNTLHRLIEKYSDFFIKNFSILFVSIGSINLLIMTATLSKCSLIKKKDRRKALLSLPIFSYNFITMLLLTGPDYRFFLFSVLVFPIYILLMFSDYKGELYEKSINNRSRSGRINGSL